MQPNEEITLNVKLSKLARELRLLRIQKGLTYKDVAAACQISVEDVVSYEMDRKTPTKATKQNLLDFLLK